MRQGQVISATQKWQKLDEIFFFFFDTYSVILLVQPFIQTEHIVYIFLCMFQCLCEKYVILQKYLLLLWDLVDNVSFKHALLYLGV